MTTTNMFQGLVGDKNSSRVLRPPGGGSSNIFGGADDSAAAAQKQKSTTRDNDIFGTPDGAQAPPARKENTADNVFGAEKAKTTPVAQKPTEDVEEEEKQEPQDTTTQEDNNNTNQKVAPPGQEEQELTPAQTAIMLQKRNQVRNPITGEEVQPSTPTDQENRTPVFNPITGTIVEASASDSTKENQLIGTYNPITGESKAQPQQPTSSTRVRQPPGGASSKLW